MTKTNKTCCHCGKEFTPNHRLGQKRIATIKFCSRECTDLSHRKVSERPCAACGSLFTPSNKRGKYCSLTCSAASHKGPAPTKGKGERYMRVAGTDGTRQLEHRVVMKKILGRDLVAGENVHHKNGDRFDNSPGNLELWYRGQPAGQRVDDLIDYIVKHHRSKLQSHLSLLLGDPDL